MLLPEIVAEFHPYYIKRFWCLMNWKNLLLIPLLMLQRPLCTMAQFILTCKPELKHMVDPLCVYSTFFLWEMQYYHYYKIQPCPNYTYKTRLCVNNTTTHHRCDKGKASTTHKCSSPLLCNHNRISFWREAHFGVVVLAYHVTKIQCSTSRLHAHGTNRHLLHRTSVSRAKFCPHILFQKCRETQN